MPAPIPRTIMDPRIHSLAMISRFYFHLISGRTRIADRVGIEAREDAVMSDAVFRVIAERWPGTSDGSIWNGWIVEMADSDGRILRTVSIVQCVCRKVGDALKAASGG